MRGDWRERQVCSRFWSERRFERKSDNHKNEGKWRRGAKRGGKGVDLHAELARAAADVRLRCNLGRAGAALAALEGADEGELPQPTYELWAHNRLKVAASAFVHSVLQNSSWDK